MATLQQSLVALVWSAADPAAAPSGTALPPLGLPDVADIQAIPMPQAGAVVGITVIGKPAAGDNVAVTPYICSDTAGSNAVAVGALTTTITNPAPAASTVTSKDTAAAQFKAGQTIELFYATTTGGSYTPRDLTVILYLQTGLEDL